MYTFEFGRHGNWNIWILEMVEKKMMGTHTRMNQNYPNSLFLSLSFSLSLSLSLAPCLSFTSGFLSLYGPFSSSLLFPQFPISPLFSQYSLSPFS
jgi:hypothetical protein